jgi:hypothetical protein
MQRLAGDDAKLIAWERWRLAGKHTNSPAGRQRFQSFHLLPPR